MSASSSSFSSFVQRNKQAVIAATAVVAVGAGLGLYYAYKATPDRAEQASPVEGTSKSKKKNEKRKRKKAAQKANASGEAVSTDNGPFALTKDPETGIEHPLVADWAEVAKLSESERKKLALQFKAAGNDAFGKKQYAKAISFYSDAVRCDATDPIFYSNRAACYSALEQYDKVIEDTTKALELKPDYLKCLSRRAVAYEKVEKYSDAVFDFTEACILSNFQEVGLNSAVDRVLRLQAMKLAREKYANEQPRLPSANFIKAYMTSYRPRDLPESVKGAAEGTGDYYIKLAFDAMSQETSESYAQAKEYFDQAVEANADNVNLALEYTATFKFLMNDAEGALQDIQRSIEAGPSPQAYVKRASIHLEQASIAQAKTDFEAALRLDENSPDVYYHRAQIAFLTGDFDAALRDYERSIELDSQFVFSQIQRAVSHYRKQAVAQAVKLFKEMMEQFPEVPDVYNYYGEILLDQGQLDAAMEQFDKAMDLEVKSSGAINVLPLVNKSIALFQKSQDSEAAEALCRKAITLDPLSEVAIGTLAQYLLQHKKTEEAIELFERNADIARSDGERIQALQFAEAARAQLRITNERPELRARLDQFASARQ
ncbi:mitochondrial import receptor subunit Tom70p [Trichomonascus vanleenenianus]|uniref:protein channel TOM70 n=1 Tax=Trichomonascus vanleenenianus TaxID=2268995 RepID=UPI003ECB0BF3